MAKDALAVEQFDWYYHLQILLAHLDPSTTVGQLLQLAHDANHRGDVLMAVCIWLDAATCALNDGDLNRCFEALELASGPFGHATLDGTIGVESKQARIDLSNPVYNQYCVVVILYLINMGRGKLATEWNVAMRQRMEQRETVSNLVVIPCGKHEYVLETLTDKQMTVLVWFLSGLVYKATDGPKGAKYLETALDTVESQIKTQGTLL